MADNSDQLHMRRMTLDYSYQQLNGLLTTLTIDKERQEKEAETADPNNALALRMMAKWTGEHIARLQAAWDQGQPLEERAEPEGITLTGVHGTGTVYVFSDDAETHVTFEEPEEGDGYTPKP
ncbi:hypothetical protein PV569_15560 [Streptomyces scabiei]|uniref:hypothetical protein n=1 Tax=Streptomyces scabiei TaxID=1930 RepID=UPI0029AF61D3|nr:hypothetical protein [Streptomyces scabiei]MDX3295124.1 hypothetical protein [Streptomyces scabiei]